MPATNLRAYSQQSDQRFRGGAGKGVCLPMSVWYLITAARGEDYWDWIEEMASVVRESGQETKHASGYFHELESAGKLFKREECNSTTQHLAINLLQGARGPFRLAVMDNPGAGQAHAIACYMGLKIRVLDVSGGGEWEFDSREEAFGWLNNHVYVPRIGFRIGDINIAMSYVTGIPKLTVYGFERRT